MKDHEVILMVMLSMVPVSAMAQDDDQDCYAAKDFLILHSSRDHGSALLAAQEASRTLGFPLDLRGLVPVADTTWGLSLPVDTCLERSREYDGQDSICYIARGRWDDGTYISIEYSSAYDGLRRGYYVVIAGSAFKGDAGLWRLWEDVRTRYTDAAIRTSRVYLCCSQ